MVESKETSLVVQDYLNVLRRRKWIASGIFLAIFISTVFFTFTSPKIYEATSKIIIQRSRKPIVGYEFETEESRNEINNQVEILRSVTLAEKVAERLRNHQEYAKFFSPNEDLIGVVLSGIAITPLTRTDIIAITVQERSGERAAAIANALVESFVEMNVAQSRGEFSEIRKFLEEQIPIVATKLYQSEKNLQEYKERNQLVSLSEETGALIDKLTEFDKLYSQTNTDLHSSEKRLYYLQEQLGQEKKDLTEKISEISSPFIAEMRKELVAQETNLSLLLVQGLTTEHPKVKELQRRIEETKSKLKEETTTLLTKETSLLDPLGYSEKLFDQILTLQIEIETLKAREEVLSKVVEKYSRRLQSLPEKEIALARLTREFNLNENIYKMLMERNEESRLAEVGKLGNARIIERAQPSPFPIKPRKTMNLVFGVLLGIALGGGVVFFLEYLDTSLKTLQDVERQLELTVLGSIPRIISEETNESKKYQNENNTSSLAELLITHHLPRSPVAESYRILRTNLRFAQPDNPLKTVLVTSAGPQEGKSTTAANLAITLAQVGAKVILVDADLRRPTLHSTLGFSPEPGLTECLIEEKKVENLIRKTEVENLFLLTSGTIPPNPSELLGSEKMKEVINQMKKCCDFVIFDSPPLTTVTDASILGAECDGVLMVIRSGKTHRELAKRGKIFLENVKAGIIGAALNDIPPESYAYGYYYHYYYGIKKEKRIRKKRGKTI
ncbi:MAG: polysaccharide biosynthesis tyrosine autokinase [Candidatus Edwardsbacteria bacterium]